MTITDIERGLVAAYGARVLRQQDLTIRSLRQVIIWLNDRADYLSLPMPASLSKTIADAYVQDTTYTLITDVQISERVPGTVISQSEQANLQQGSSGTITQSSSGTSDAKRYRTRIVSTANQANLAWPDAEPQLVAGLTRSIGGMF